MADEKKAAPSAPKPAAPKTGPALASASQSSDPAVHQLLAELQTARSNGADELVEALTRRLAGLGFE